MLVPFKLSFNHLADERVYRGALEIGNAKFNYSVEFATPIPELDANLAADGVERLRQVVKLVVKKNEQVLDLTDHEYAAFYLMSVKHLIEYYYEKRPLKPGAEESRFAWCELPLKLCEIFNGPGFDSGIGVQ